MTDHDSAFIDDQPADDDAAELSGVEDVEAPSSDQLRAELEESRARTLRAQADLDNYRKRAQRDMAQERRYADMALLRDLLPVADNVQRAIDAARDNDQAGGLLEGFQMVAQQLQTVFAQHHCTPMGAVGETFDPNLHEAVSQLPSDEYASGTIMNVTSIGYLLHDRVVRPVQVVVSSGKPE